MVQQSKTQTSRISLGLGTVQLGVPYGNKSHAPVMKKEDAFAILSAATKNGVYFYDTAVNYGESEARLGEFFRTHSADSFEISTKIPHCEESVWALEKNFFEFVFQNIEKSRLQLNISKHKLIQFHQCSVPFLNAKSVQNCFTQLLEKGLCEQIGISIYNEEQAQIALGIPAVSALQIPCNVVDTRFRKPTMQQIFNQKKTRLLVRSVVMQGLLISNADLPKCRRISELKTLKHMLLEIGKKTNRSLEDLALGFMFQNCKDNFDVALLGIDTVSSFENNVTLIQKSQPVDARTLSAFEDVYCHMATHNLLNPAAWL